MGLYVRQFPENQRPQIFALPDGNPAVKDEHGHTLTVHEPEYDFDMEGDDPDYSPSVDQSAARQDGASSNPSGSKSRHQRNKEHYQKKKGKKTARMVRQTAAEIEALNIDPVRMVSFDMMYRTHEESYDGTGNDQMRCRFDDEF